MISNMGPIKAQIAPFSSDIQHLEVEYQTNCGVIHLSPSSYIASPIPYCSWDTAADTITMGRGSPIL